MAWGCWATKRVTDDGVTVWDWPATEPVTDDETGEEEFACPRQPVREQPAEWGRMLLFYSLYLKGHLPDEGAVSSQANYAIEVFTILDDVNRQCDRELEARARAKGDA